jgi:thioesterase domain-containing protein/acyl carrier protein
MIVEIGRAPPMTNEERTLKDIWEDVLNVAPLEVHDNFFDLGGHSLLAVRVFSEIRKRFDRNLPLITLFRAPTIKRLAQAIAESEPAGPWSPLVELAPHRGAAAAARQPLFIVHGLTGEVANLHALAVRLAAERPVYGIRARGLDGIDPPFERIEDMAACYIGHIRRIQPHGPYWLAGFCFGGLVAFEMARQLSLVGETVAFLGLLDSGFNDRFMTLPGRIRFAAAKQRIHAETICRLSFRDRLAYIGTKVGARFFRSGPEREPLPWTRDFSYLPQTSIPTELRAVIDSAMHAFRNYRPGLYPGKLTYFRPLSRDFRNILDFGAEWRRKAIGGVETVYVPGDHSTMLEAPAAVDVLAERLRRYIGAGCCAVER